MRPAPSRQVGFESDERPTRDGNLRKGKENLQRNTITIDENDDTFHNQGELASILARGQKLRDQMDQALDSDMAWQSIHGPHIVPKKYVPPFLSKGREGHDEESDRMYELEFDEPKGADGRRNIEE